MHIYCLIIEDEPVGASIIKRYIAQTPFLKTAFIVDSLQDAMNFINRQKPDIVFLDIRVCCH